MDLAQSPAKSPSCAAPSTLPLRQPSRQGELFRAERGWFPVLKALIQSGTMARIGPFGIAAYISLKSSAELHNGQAEHVSASLIARQTGMSERAAREAVKKLEAEGLVRATWRAGRKKVFQLVERIPILDADGEPAGEAAWDFAALKWGQQLKDVVDGAMRELEARAENRKREPHSTTINIGSINVNVLVTSIPPTDRAP